MNRAHAIRNFPKAGWKNMLARSFLSLTQRSAPTQFADYQTHAALYLPFDGEWHVYLPAQFLDYIADGKPVSRGEPAAGQTIRSQRARHQ